MNVLVRADSPHWAFAKRARNYANYPPDGWNVGYADDSHTRADEDWDAVLLLDCNASPLIYGDVSYARLVASHTWCHNKSPHDWRTRGCNESRCLDNVKRMLGRCGVVAVYNTEQLAALQQASVRQRIVLAPYSVDCRLFSPAVREPNRKLRVGWNYQVSGGLNSFKGLTDVLIPLVARLGDAVDWDIQTPDQHSCMGTHHLVNWLQQLDIFLCTSSGEGGPQGPFEAAACGCLVVSTDVGQISDWRWLRENGLIVPTYSNYGEARQTVDAMANVISRLLVSSNMDLEYLSSGIMNDIRTNWNAEIECPRQLQEIFG